MYETLTPSPAEEYPDIIDAVKRSTEKIMFSPCRKLILGEGTDLFRDIKRSYVMDRGVDELEFFALWCQAEALVTIEEELTELVFDLWMSR